MNKTNWYILVGIFLCLVVGITVASIRTVKAETSTTFPVDEAGIAAYVKVNNIGNIDLNVLAEALHTVERQAESYVIGMVKVDNIAGGAEYPHVYVGMDGWIVAYYLKTEEASRIMQWKGYTAGSINTTTLKDAIDYISAKIGVAYSEPIKYYDFEFPEANKMTLIAESIRYEGSNDFYVGVPGTLYEASYAVYRYNYYSFTASLTLKVDDIIALEESLPWVAWTWKTSFGYYDSSAYFTAGVTHHVILQCSGPGCNGTYSASALIYKN